MTRVEVGNEQKMIQLYRSLRFLTFLLIPHSSHKTMKVDILIFENSIRKNNCIKVNFSSDQIGDEDLNEGCKC